MNQKQHRFELWAISCFAVAVGIYLLLANFQPWLGQQPQLLPFQLSVLMMLGVFAAITLAILALKTRPRSLLWSLPAFLVLWLAGSHFSRGEFPTESFERHFSAHEPGYYRALDWTLMQPRQGENVLLSLPEDLQRLTRNGQVLYHRSGDGVETIAFLVFLSGIDNERGFAWTSDGKPPVQGSVPEKLVSARDLRPGWFLFSTT